MLRKGESIGRKPWIPPPAKSATFRRIPLQKSNNAVVSAIELLTAARPSSQSIPSSSGDFACKKFQEFHNDTENMRAHYCSLESCLQFLKGPFRACPTEELPANAFITEAISLLNSFSEAFGELLSHLETFEKDLKEGLSGWIASVERCQTCREDAFSKLLKAYEGAVVAFRLVLEIINNADSSNIQLNEDHLKNASETLKAQVLELERELTASKEEIKSLQCQKASVENENALLKGEVQEKLLVLHNLALAEQENGHLKHELSEKTQFLQKQTSVESEVEVLKQKLATKDQLIEQLQYQIMLQDSSTNKNSNDLLQFAEGLSNQHNTEKETLRKSVMVQKELLDKKEITIKELEAKLGEKENALCNIANERDQWKKNITALHNQLIDAITQIQNLQRQNSALEDKLCEFQKFHEEEWDKMHVALQQKDEVIEKLETGIESANQLARDWQRKSENSENELQSLKLCYEQLNRELQLQKENISKSLVEESKTLVSVLQEMKSHFASVEKAGVEELKAKDVNTQENDTLAKLLQDVRYHLIEVKDLFQQDWKKEFMASLEKQRSEFQKLFEKEIKEKRKLQGQCEYLENMVKGDHISSSVLDDVQAISKSYYKGLAIEATGSHDLYPESSAYRSDQERAEKSIKKLRKELQEKELQLSIEKNERSQAEKKLRNEVKELKDKLSRTEVEYECLRKYTKNLKHSYEKIYGISS